MKTLSYSPIAHSKAALKVWCSSINRLEALTQKSMKTKITLINKLGLHARASAKLTKMAGSFPCQVWLARGERRVNAKSIMGVMMLAAGVGTEIEIETEGEQAQAAMEALVQLIAGKFGEGE